MADSATEKKISEGGNHEKRRSFPLTGNNAPLLKNAYLFELKKL
jgi:hypothetical protein